MKLTYPIRAIATLICAAVALTACSGSASEGRSITLLTHDSFAISEEVLTKFTSNTGFSVKVLRSGDAGSMVSQAILTKDDPIADVLYGIDNTFLSRALEASIFEEYRPANLDTVQDDLVLDQGNRVAPIDIADVCLNYDKQTFAALGLDPPASLREVASPRYASQLVVENPGTSSPGLAFLFSTIAEFPDDADYTWQDFWAELRDNGVLVASDWSTAYYSEFAGGGDGGRGLVVSYASSPPAGVIFSDPPQEIAPTGVVLPGCFRQIEFAGILSGTAVPEGARALIDFMLDVEFQEDIPLNMFVFPVNSRASLPDAFVKHTSVPDSPNSIDPDVIDANRDSWIEEWTEIMRS